MPLSVRIGVTVLLFALAAALAVTVVRARLGRLRRTGLAGVRTPSALVDDRAFQRANRAALPYLAIGAVLAAVLAVLVAVTGLRQLGGSLTLIIGGVVLGALLVGGGLRGERAARVGSDHPTPAAARRSGNPARSANGAASPKGDSRSGVSGRDGGPRRPSR